MKIILEPTRDEKTYSRVEIKVFQDDLDIANFIERLIIPILLAYGFSESLIREYIEECDL